MRGPTQRHPAARPQPWGEGQPPASAGSTGGPLQSSRLRSPGPRCAEQQTCLCKKKKKSYLHCLHCLHCLHRAG